MEPELVSAASTVNSLLTGLFIILMIISLLELIRVVLRILARWWLPLDQPRCSTVTSAMGVAIGVLFCLWVDADLMSIAFTIDASETGMILSGLVLGESAALIYKVAPPCYPRSVSTTTVPFEEQK